MCEAGLLFTPAFEKKVESVQSELTRCSALDRWRCSEVPVHRILGCVAEIRLPQPTVVLYPSPKCSYFLTSGKVLNQTEMQNTPVTKEQARCTLLLWNHPSSNVAVISCRSENTAHASVSPLTHSFWLIRWIPVVCVCKQARWGIVGRYPGLLRDVGRASALAELEGAERGSSLTISRLLSWTRCCLWRCNWCGGRREDSANSSGRVRSQTWLCSQSCCVEDRNQSERIRTPYWAFIYKVNKCKSTVLSTRLLSFCQRIEIHLRNNINNFALVVYRYSCSEVNILWSWVPTDA